MILTAQQLYTAAGLLEMAEVLLSERVPVAYGGLIFTHVPDLTLSIPGYYLGDRLDKIAIVVDQIMSALRTQPAQRFVSYGYREALDHFRTRQALIEAEIWQHLGDTIPKRFLALANQSLSRNILAALTLGDMDYLDADIDWIEGLLVNHNQMPADALDLYLGTYYDAAVKHLDKPGYLVIDWFARLLGRELPARCRTRPHEQTLDQVTFQEAASFSEA